MDFKSDSVKQFISNALEEDIGEGDHSTLSCIGAEIRGKAHLLFKESGVVAGIALAQEILFQLDPLAEFELFVSDGDHVQKGDIGFIVRAKVHAILGAERLLLNCMQRLSGIATYTNSLVKMIGRNSSKVLDTRKTTPGLRVFEKWAVKIGGGENHRIGLYDMIMLKDNHVDYAGGISKAVIAADSYRKSNKPSLKIEVETRNLNEVGEALSTGLVDRIMLDNFTPELLEQALKLINGACETEASGGITEKNLIAYAETGVDYISMGALTHSVKSLDISLKQIS